MNKSRLLESLRAGASDPFHAAKYHGKDSGGDQALYAYAAAQQQAAVMSEVSKEMIQLGREQFTWGKEQADKQFSLLQPLIESQLDQLRKAGVRDDEMHELRKQMETEYLGQMKFATTVQEEGYDLAKERLAREKEMYWPAEEKFVKDAMGYDTEARREEEAGRAASDVARAFEANRAAETRRLQAYGMDPSQGVQRGLGTALEIGQATGSAGAETGARRNVENVGRALVGDVVNIGRGMPSTVGGSYGLALQAGQQGIGAGQAAFGNAAGAAGSSLAQLQGYGNIAGQYGQNAGLQMGLRNSGMGYFTGGLQGLQGAGGIYNQAGAGYSAIDRTNAEQNAGFWQGVGSIAGMGLGSVGGVGGWGRFFQAEGGPVRGLGDGSGIDDRVPAQLSKGEYVIPKDVVDAKGLEFFNKLVEKHHTPAAVQRRQMASARPQRYADGGERGHAAEMADIAEDAIEILPVKVRRRLIREAALSLGMRI